MPAKPFVLAVKAVIFDDQQRCLLVRRSDRNRHFVDCWEWPGGKVGPGEDFAATLVREAHEETALDIEITGLAGATQFEMPGAHVVLLCMAARVTGGQLRLSEEHTDSAWVPLSDLPKRELPAQIRAFMLDYAAREQITRKNPHPMHPV